MSLIVEDGSGVSGAESYATVVAARTFAANRGVTLSSTDSAVEILLRQACDYLQSLESQFLGERVNAAQALAYPRKEVFLFNSHTPLADNAIPSQLIGAQCQLVIDALTTPLQPSSSGPQVQSRKVDVLETSFFEGQSGKATPSPSFPKAMGLLAPLLINQGRVSVVRV